MLRGFIRAIAFVIISFLRRQKPRFVFPALNLVDTRVWAFFSVIAVGRVFEIQGNRRGADVLASGPRPVTIKFLEPRGESGFVMNYVHT